MKMPGTEFGYTLNLKTLIPFKVQHPLPSIGLDLYQLGVHIRAKKKKKKKKNSCTTTVKHNFSILLGEVEDRQVDSLSVIANNSIHRWAVV